MAAVQAAVKSRHSFLRELPVHESRSYDSVQPKPHRGALYQTAADQAEKDALKIVTVRGVGHKAVLP